MTEEYREHDTGVLFPKQEAFVFDGSFAVAAVTGRGGGKTRSGAIKLLMYLMANPGALVMVTAPNHSMLHKVVWPMIEEVWPEELTRDVKTSPELHLVLPRMGDAFRASEVYFKSTDNPEDLRGPNLAAAWMEEAAYSPERAFEVLLGGVRDKRFPSQIWLTTTPNGYNWVWKAFKKEPVAAGYKLHHWTTWDNPHNRDGYAKGLEERYTKEFARQEVMGEFTPVSGSMYFRLEGLQEMLDALPFLDAVAPPASERGGLITRYRKPIVAGRYVLGLDTAWGKTGSYSCGHVASFETMEEVCRIHGRPDLDELAQVTYELHREYNRAYILAEWAGDEDEGQYVVRKLVELGCGPWMYYRDGDGLRQKPGFVTDGSTRPWILANLEEAVRNKRFIPRSKEDLMEFMGFVRDEKGRPSAAEGMKDDAVMAWALCWEARTHAVFGEQELAKGWNHLRKKVAR